MRALVIAIVVASSPAVADVALRHEDAELARPELRSLTATTYEPAGGKLVEKMRERRVYDTSGHPTRQDFTRPDGTSITFYERTWDAGGRLASRKTRDGAGVLVARTFTYKLDGSGRIAERTMRDPSAPAGEYYIDIYTWSAGGGYSTVMERHYAKEGPYRSDTASYDSQGRITQQCHEHGGCSLFEYDARGNLSRVREQTATEHYYRVYETTYDAAGRVTKRIVGGTEDTFKYNARGDVSEVIGKLAGNITHKTIYTYEYR